MNLKVIEQEKITYNNNLCVYCGKCLVYCKSGAISKNKKGYIIFNQSKCIQCMDCVQNCPRNAFFIELSF